MDLKEAARIMREKIVEFCPEYHFEWNGGKRMLGQCCYTTKTLSLSKHLVPVNSDEEIMNVILHEVAHAIAGPGAGHKYKWKRAAVSIGCSGERTAPRATLAKPNFIGTCPNCKKEHSAYRVRRRKSACSACCNKYNGGRFSEQYVFEYKKVEDEK